MKHSICFLTYVLVKIEKALSNSIQKTSISCVKSSWTTLYTLRDVSSCNDALEWEDGTNFLRNPDAQPVVAATETDSDSNCFVVETDRFTDRPCSAQYNPFLCQFTCTGKMSFTVVRSEKF